MWYRRALVLLIKIMPSRFNPEKAEIPTTTTEVTRSYSCSAPIRMFYLSMSGFRIFPKDTIDNRSAMPHFV